MEIIIKKEFEKCEGCYIKNKAECLKLFGSKDCARMLVESIYSESKRIVDDDFDDNFSQAEADRREQDEYFSEGEF